MKIKGAKILITGGSSGLGKAMARMLKDKGAALLITGRDLEKLKAVAEELDVHYLAANVAEEKEVKKTFEFVQEKLGGLDVLINNAGIGTDRLKIHELDIEKMKEVYNVNVFGLAMMAREAAKIFKKQQSGNLVNIASTAATKGYEGGTIYSSSKFAVRGLSQTWQAELRRDNVRVFNINPSYVPTAFNQPDRQERDLESNKLTPEEIAHAVVAALEMDERGYIPELAVHATNPF
jgi:3-oxoacyl-[acyl-carrier protein] reductase